MQLVKIYKLILCLAAILFIARPFIGFSVYNQLHDREETSLFVKIFSKRKPEFLEDGADYLVRLHQLIKERATDFQFTFNQCLAVLFVQLLALSALFLGRHFVTYRRALPQTAPIYLLTRQLTI